MNPIKGIRKYIRPEISNKFLSCEREAFSGEKEIKRRN